MILSLIFSQDIFFFHYVALLWPLVLKKQTFSQTLPPAYATGPPGSFHTETTFIGRNRKNYVVNKLLNGE